LVGDTQVIIAAAAFNEAEGSSRFRKSENAIQVLKR
jgi:hypothetical protein